MAAPFAVIYIKEMRPMDDVMIETYLENLDQRLTRVEQILPTLPTKEDLRSATAPLATKKELREEIERLRRHMTILNEATTSKIELIAEHVLELLRRNRSNE